MFDVCPDFTQSTGESNGDNRSFADTNTAQKLSTTDISKLKSDGASATDIINSLIANSETWSSKSEFSQEKWLKRKQKKYCITSYSFKILISIMNALYLDMLVKLEY